MLSEINAVSTSILLQLILMSSSLSLFSLEFTSKIREEYHDIQKRMNQASKWREAIVGEPYDLEFLHKMGVKINIRQELWKYMEITSYSIKEWKKCLFTKVSRIRY